MGHPILVRKRYEKTVLAERGYDFLVFVALAAVPVYSASPAQPDAARGPVTPLNPADQTLSAQQLDAQSLAVADSDVLATLGSGRAEVFEVFPLFAPFAVEWAACASGECYQVDIYNFDSLATVTAIVDHASGEVVDHFRVEKVYPLISKRLYNRAIEIVQQSADVEAALGFVPEPAQIRLMDLNHLDFPLRWQPPLRWGNLLF